MLQLVYAKTLILYNHTLYALESSVIPAPLPTSRGKIGPGCATFRQKQATMIILAEFVSIDKGAIGVWNTHTPSNAMNEPSSCSKAPLYPFFNSAIR